MDYQFYPTHPALARKAWGKFKNRDFVRVLDPAGGEGHLIAEAPDIRGYNRHAKIPIDAIEIDLSKHPALMTKANVVGLDFMNFGAGAIYSHIIMNAPFALGAQFVLRAWEILFQGEISAIINAETIRNPYSKERQALVALIEKYAELCSNRTSLPLTAVATISASMFIEDAPCQTSSREPVPTSSPA